MRLPFTRSYVASRVAELVCFALVAVCASVGAVAYIQRHETFPAPMWECALDKNGCFMFNRNSMGEGAQMPIGFVRLQISPYRIGGVREILGIDKNASCVEITRIVNARMYDVPDDTSWKKIAELNYLRNLAYCKQINAAEKPTYESLVADHRARLLKGRAMVTRLLRLDPSVSDAVLRRKSRELCSAMGCASPRFLSCAIPQQPDSEWEIALAHWGREPGDECVDEWPPGYDPVAALEPVGPEQVIPFSNPPKYSEPWYETVYNIGADLLSRAWLLG